MYTTHFTYLSFSGGQFGCFHLFAIMDSAAMNVGVQGNSNFLTWGRYYVAQRTMSGFKDSVRVERGKWSYWWSSETSLTFETMPRPQITLLYLKVSLQNKNSKPSFFCSWAWGPYLFFNEIFRNKNWKRK